MTCPQTVSCDCSRNVTEAKETETVHIEHILDGNIVCFVRLEGSFSLNQLRSALSRVQRKHPALRALIREEADGLVLRSGQCAGDSTADRPTRD